MQRGLLKVFKEKTVEGINKSTLKALQDRGLIDDFSVITSNGYTYGNGWPDLTLIKDNEVLFIEVKTTDKMHESQLITIPEMRSITAFKFVFVRW